MGISKEAFGKTHGYGNIHPGEDPDLTFRIWEAGFETKLIEDAFVYHKRRIDWNKFYRGCFFVDFWRFMAYNPICLLFWFTFCTLFGDQ